MRKILAVTVLTVAVSAVAYSQTSGGQTKRSQSEELIALSQEFVKTSIGVVEVQMGGVRMTRSGPISTAEVKRQWDAVGIRDARVNIDGGNAVVTGQVIFEGQAPEDKTRASSSRVTIHFLKEKERWKFVKGCFSECDER